ncbi:localization factor PodJL [Ancylobacter aquaticus]|uniref:Localization factor PodJL n=2 Tax=Ancylobacter aquaticus TaxID=100 RepID=A0A4R1I6G8_ANCAQ|nr:localization factor PodJL [Ancylobacter aquaticus]
MGTTAAGTPPAGIDGLNNLAELRRRIEELAGQIGRADLATATDLAAPAEHPASSPPADVSAMVAPARVAAPESPRAPSSTGSTYADERLAAAMREIDQRLEALQLTRRRTVTPEAAPSPAAIEAAVAEIAARQSELDRDGRRRRVENSPEALPPAASALESIAPETPSPEAPLPEVPARPAAPLAQEALTALQNELSGLRQAVGTLAPRRSVDELQRVVQQLVERVERSETRDEGLRATLAALREMIGGLRLPEPPDLLLGRIGALERKIDIVNAKVVDGATVARLQAQISEIRELLARALSSDSVRLLAEQVSLLASRVAEMAASEDEAVRTAFGSLEQRIETLSERIGTPSPLPLDDLLGRLDAIQTDLASARRELPAGMETLIKGLSDRIERIERPLERADDGARFEALGRQIADLSQRVGKALDGTGVGGTAITGTEIPGQLSSQLAGIERAVNDLFIQMEETRASLLAAPRPRPPSGSGSDPEGVAALIRREIAALEGRLAAEKPTERASFSAAAAEAAVAAELASLAAVPPQVKASAITEPAFTPAPASIPKAFEPQLMRAALEALSRTSAAPRRAPVDTPSRPVSEAEGAPPAADAAPGDSAPSRAAFIAQARRAASPAANSALRPAANRPPPGAPVELRSHIGTRAAPPPGRWLARIRATLVIALCGSALAYGSWHLLAQFRQEQLSAAGPATVPGPEDITGSIGNGAPRAPAAPSSLFFSR